jgi:putative oxidoreductase
MFFEKYLTPYRPQLLSLMRIVIGLLLVHYGIATLFKYPAVPTLAGSSPLTMFAGTMELIGGALLLIGLCTRPAAFIVSGFMASAFFIGHVFKTDTPVIMPVLNGGATAILYCFSCLYISAAGGGPWSIDAMRKK